MADADLILHVVDAADADPEAQISAVRAVLGDIDALSVPEQLVFNKVDAADAAMVLRLRRLAPDAVFVSALTGDGIDELRQVIEARGCHGLRSSWRYWCLIPAAIWWRAYMRRRTSWAASTRADGTVLHARVDPGLAAALEPYRTGAGVA